MKVLKTPLEMASRIMQIDADLLQALDPAGEPVLHFYQWRHDALTYGYFVDIEQWVQRDVAYKKGLDMARRPTGGGVVFHIWDFAFSFLMPSGHPMCFADPLKNYHFVHALVQKAIIRLLPPEAKSSFFHPPKSSSDLSFCMAQPSQYDLLIDQKKIAGAAQRRKKNGYLHQGTISLALPDREYLQEVVLAPKMVDQIFASTYPLLGSCTPKRLLEAKQELQELLQETFFRHL
ncbi:MAG: hypothetical protein JW769_03645 [Parachlamydiales bacterium]|nr:hypothetical protein [Parachlamydiales bacterium]